MKKLKAVTIFIFLFGVLCCVLGGLMLLTLQRNLQTWELLQLAGSEGAQVLTVAELRAGIITHSIWYLFLGLLTMVCSVGLFLLKEWARKLWLGVLVIFAVATLYWLLGDVYQGRMLNLDNLIGYPLLAALIIGMWLYFTRQKTRTRYSAAPEKFPITSYQSHYTPNCLR